MTINAFCNRIKTGESKFKSRVLVIPAYDDFSAVCSNYGEQFSVVPVSQFVHSDGFIPMADRVFESLEDKRKELKAQSKHMIVVGLDGYLALLEQDEVRRAFNFIVGYLNGAGIETVIFVFRQRWEEMNDVFTHPSIISNSIFCPIGVEAGVAVPGRKCVLVSKDFSTRIPNCYPDLRTYLETLEQWTMLPDGDVCIAVGFNGRHKFPGLSRDIRQYCVLKDLFSEYCGFKADLSDDAFKWISKNTSGVAINEELMTHFFPSGIHLLCESALTRNEQCWESGECEVFQQQLRTVAPRGSYLADVLNRVSKDPNQFLSFYLNVADDVLLADNATKMAEERNDAIKRFGVGRMEVKAGVSDFIARTKDWSAERMMPWLKLGLDIEEEEWIRRAVAGNEAERYLAQKQSGLLVAHRSNKGLEKYPELGTYLEEYRSLKCADKITDEFMKKALNSSDPNEIDLRTVRLSEYKTDNETAVLVVDALGIEYLPFLLARCKVHRFEPKVVECVRVNLPTSTEFNKVDEEWGMNDRYQKYNGFDALLHSTFRNHVEALAAELREIDVQVMGKVENLLATYRQVILTADHGATRLAVIARRDGKSRDLKEFEGKIDIEDWRYAKRVCPNYLESDFLQESINNDFALVKGYNRLPKHGAPGFEMHGGATIEEQVVPFLVIERATTRDNPDGEDPSAETEANVVELVKENKDFDI